MSDEDSSKEGPSEENPVIISDDEDSDSDTIHTMTPHFSGALDQGLLQNVPQNFRLDGTAPISTSAGSSKRQCLESGQPFRKNRARAHSKDHIFDMQLQLFSHEYFSLLSPLCQKQYFNEISEALHLWQNLGYSCPRIDKFILSRYDNDNRLTATEQWAAALMQESIERKWALFDVSLEDSSSACATRRPSESARWFDDDLRWNAVTSKFDLVPPQVSRSCYQYGPDRPIGQHGFFYHISSPQLLYRINLLIGDLKDSTTDRYKCSWEIRIRHRESNSTLRLWDSKGIARAEFFGSKESEQDALEVINHLTGYKFPHTYDGVLAGTMA